MQTNFTAGMQAVNYLLKKGHSDILLFGNIDYSFSFLQRYHGCMKAVKRALSRGEKVECYKLIDCKKTSGTEGVYQDEDAVLCDDDALNEFFAGRNDVTAAVCFNESVLQRFMAILEKRGLKIPGRRFRREYRQYEVCGRSGRHLRRYPENGTRCAGGAHAARKNRKPQDQFSQHGVNTVLIEEIR